MKKIIILSAVLLSIIAVSVFTFLSNTPKAIVNQNTSIVGSELIESSILNDPKEQLKLIFANDKTATSKYKSVTNIEQYGLKSKSGTIFDYLSFPKSLIAFDDSKFSKPYIILDKKLNNLSGDKIELDNGLNINIYKLDTDITYQKTKLPMIVFSDDIVSQVEQYKINDSKDYKVKVIEFNTIEQKKEFDKSITPLN
jgi:hypothetical protein